MRIGEEGTWTATQGGGKTRTSKLGPNLTINLSMNGSQTEVLHGKGAGHCHTVQFYLGFPNYLYGMQPK